MKIKPSSGLIMHITSLPGKFGIGTLGQEAYDFVDSLREGGQTYWQVLPLTPVFSIYGYSPYSSLSCFAGNYLMINLELIQKEKWMRTFFLSELKENEFTDFVDFQSVEFYTLPILKNAAENFYIYAEEDELKAFKRFCDSSYYWLNDYALFCAVAEHLKTYNWSKWDDDIRFRKESAIKEYSEKLKAEIDFHKFVQYIFYKQFGALRDYANKRGVRIIGDMAIYANYDSADVWGNPSVFLLEPDTLHSVFVAGVPPDYFSPTGQRWGNPLYRWKIGNRLNPDMLDWWKHRFEHMNKYFDFTRVDHFRAFASYWAIPAHENSAINGEWKTGPGIEFFKYIERELGNLPLIAEDLGIITPDVDDLREKLDIPGMKVLQFAFDYNNKNAYLPHNYKSSNCVVYTGTHDNNTTNGWFYEGDISEDNKEYVLRYLNCNDKNEFHWKLITLAMSSIAVLSLFPTQDILGYSGRFRMNKPGSSHHNWSWKLTPGRLNHSILKRLKDLCVLYNRI